MPNFTPLHPPFPRTRLVNHLKRLDPYLLTSILLGFALALYRYGWGALNPTSFDWLMHGADSAQHLVGWLFFAGEPWHFPPGLITRFWWPIGTSIGYTDGLPLLAFPFKLISFALPTNFQYFGPWMFVSYMLQAALGYRLMTLATSQRSLRLVGSLFFLFCPILFRHPTHEALSSHWILLASLWVYLVTSNRFSLKSFIIRWTIIVGLVGLIHPYLVAMVLAIVFASILREMAISREISPKTAIAFLVGLVALLLIEWYLTGFFSYQDMGYGDEDLSVYSLNLNALVNPVQFSRWLPGLAQQASPREHGYVYIGLGGILLVSLGVFLFFIQLIKDPKGIWRRVFLNHLSLWIACLGLLTFALGNQIYLGDRVLLAYTLDWKWLQEISAIFRVWERFVWPIVYLLFFASLLLIVRMLPPRASLVIISLGLLVQITDLKDIQPVLNHQPYTGYIDQTSWRKLTSSFETIITIPAYSKDMVRENDFRDFAYLAATTQTNLASGYLSRFSFQAIQEERARIYARLATGTPAPDTLYVLSEYWMNWFIDNLVDKFRCHRLDDFIACYSQKKGALIEKKIDLLEYQATHRVITLAELLQLYQDNTILLAVRYDGSKALDESSREYLTQLGSRIESLEFWASYAAILHEGKFVVESIDSLSDITLAYPAGTRLALANGELVLPEDIHIYSSGYPFGEDADIRVAGASTANGWRGLNLVILNDQFEMIARAVFDDTWPGSGVLEIITPDEE